MTVTTAPSPAGSISTPFSFDEMRATAAALVAPGRGVLAVDESVTTMDARLEAAGVPAGEARRRDYRELLLTAPGLAAGVSGAILNPETLAQTLRDGEPFADRLRRDGIAPGVKVDLGTTSLPRTDESITEGLDGLAARLDDHRRAGAVFAKWRAVLRVGPRTPSPRAVAANAHALARYAAVCQSRGIVPIVEPEVLMDGDHSPTRCALVTSTVLHQVFRQLVVAGVDLTAMVLKPNLVTPGRSWGGEVGSDEVAEATLSVLRAHVPAAVPGVAFLSGGLDPAAATAHLAALHRLAVATDAPWRVTFSFGRALVDPALAAWGGQESRRRAGQDALLERVRANAAAVAG